MGLAVALMLAPPADALSVKKENRLRGDRKWRVRSTDATRIEGYASEQSVQPGEVIRLHVNVPSPARYRVEIHRLGWYRGKGGRRLACLPSCGSDRPGVQQPPPPAPDPATGFFEPDWSVTDSFIIPTKAASGYYTAEFHLTSGPYAGESTYYPFVVTDPTRGHSRIAVQVPTATWTAYNAWGGRSLYPFTGPKSKATHVSFHRPMPSVEHQSTMELPLVRFLERRQKDVTYLSDLDVERNPDQLLGHRLVMTNGHAEYWTHGQFDAFEAARDAGVNLAFMGANTAYWQVRYEDGGSTLVGYKSRPDPIGDPTLKTVRFRDLEPPRPECSLLGAQFEGRVPDKPPPGTGRAFRVRRPRPRSWFRGTGLRRGDLIKRIVSGEWDRHWKWCRHARVLFHLPSPGGYPADATRYVAPSGAQVFDASTHYFNYALDNLAPPRGHRWDGLIHRDPRIARFVSNLLRSTTR